MRLYGQAVGVSALVHTVGPRRTWETGSSFRQTTLRYLMSTHTPKVETQNKENGSNPEHLHTIRPTRRFGNFVNSDSWCLDLIPAARSSTFLLQVVPHFLSRCTSSPFARRLASQPEPYWFSVWTLVAAGTTQSERAKAAKLSMMSSLASTSLWFC